MYYLKTHNKESNLLNNKRMHFYFEYTVISLKKCIMIPKTVCLKVIT